MICNWWAKPKAAQAAIQLCAKILPDVILMDMVMPMMDGATATRAIRQQFPQVQVIASDQLQRGGTGQERAGSRGDRLFTQGCLCR